MQMIQSHENTTSSSMVQVGKSKSKSGKIYRQSAMAENNTRNRTERR
jgi:hypothetical protein